jgi:hypothetical protein
MDLTNDQHNELIRKLLSEVIAMWPHFKDFWFQAEWDIVARFYVVTILHKADPERYGAKFMIGPEPLIRDQMAPVRRQIESVIHSFGRRGLV